MALAGTFLTGAGGASVGSLIFYSVAVKGYTRYRGTLIGALVMGFNMNWGPGAIGAFGLLFGLRWGDWAIADEAAGVLIGSSGVILTLAGGTSLFLLLPRWSTGTYEPGPTLRETVAVPGAKIQIIRVAAVYFVAAMTLSVVSVLVWRVNMEVAQEFANPEFALQALALTGGTGALLWGISTDFFPVRRLLITLAVLSLPAAGWRWVFDDPAVGTLLLSLVRGGLISLPWVLMADLLPVRHFAKLALPVTCVGWVGRAVGQFSWGWALAVWGREAFVWIVVVEAAAILALVIWHPRAQEAGE